MFKKAEDLLGVLPTGFGKSLIFHLLSEVECEGPPMKGKAITVVIAPLNAHFLAVSNLRLVRVSVYLHKSNLGHT